MPDEQGQRGVFVNTSSISGIEGQIGAVSYAAAKAGIAGMTLPLAREFSRYGIRVVAIAPGLFETPMVGALRQSEVDKMIAGVPFPHRFGRPEEYARLARDIIENPMLNGEIIRLDAAFRIGGL
jgi:Dehydrogenases with different specificities (related to short-chain alcohol dehydrogenases)